MVEWLQQFGGQVGSHHLAPIAPLTYSARRPAGGDPLWAARLFGERVRFIGLRPEPGRAFCHGRAVYGRRARTVRSRQCIWPGPHV